MAVYHVYVAGQKAQKNDENRATHYCVRWLFYKSRILLTFTLYSTGYLRSSYPFASSIPNMYTIILVYMLVDQANGIATFRYFFNRTEHHSNTLCELLRVLIFLIVRRVAPLVHYYYDGVPSYDNKPKFRLSTAEITLPLQLLRESNSEYYGTYCPGTLKCWVYILNPFHRNVLYLYPCSRAVWLLSVSDRRLWVTILVEWKHLQWKTNEWNLLLHLFTVHT